MDVFQDVGADLSRDAVGLISRLAAMMPREDLQRLIQNTGLVHAEAGRSQFDLATLGITIWCHFTSVAPAGRYTLTPASVICKE